MKNKLLHIITSRETLKSASELLENAGASSVLGLTIMKSR